MRTIISVFWVMLFTQGAFALVGGKDAQLGQFPSVVVIHDFGSGCTAAKIGPHQFLTAAHCLYAGPGDFFADRYLSVNHYTHDYSLTIDRVDIHPSWLKACKKIQCDGDETGTPQDSPGKVDLAIVTVIEESDTIPYAPVDTSAVEMGDALVLTGMGCQGSGGIGMSSGLRYADLKAISVSELKHSGSVYASTAEQYGKSYFVTPGVKMGEGNASLCPGDSGGPVYRIKGNQQFIIGVNADYTFDSQDDADNDLSHTNLHTRLDHSSLCDVGSWVVSHLKNN